MSIQHQRILKVLENGEKLSALSAWKELGIARLSARISELRQMGYQIESFRVETENQFGERTHFAQYILKGQRKELKSLI